jgi:hypothetical protein
MLAVAASGQAANSNLPTIVLPIAGVPLTVEATVDFVTDYPDGTFTKAITNIKIYRDAGGRMRVETARLRNSGDPFRAVLLIDHVDGFIAALETRGKIAHREKISPGGLFGISMGGTGLRGVRGEKAQKNEILGKQTIDAIEYIGTRETTTSKDQPWLVAIYERWTSRKLGLIGLVKYSGPDGTVTSQIQNVDRAVPDPSLFVIPDDYRIREIVPPSPPIVR